MAKALPDLHAPSTPLLGAIPSVLTDTTSRVEDSTAPSVVHSHQDAVYIVFIPEPHNNSIYAYIVLTLHEGSCLPAVMAKCGVNYVIIIEPEAYPKKKLIKAGPQLKASPI